MGEVKGSFEERYLRLRLIQRDEGRLLVTRDGFKTRGQGDGETRGVKSEEAEVEVKVEVENFGFLISDLPSVSSASLRFGL